MEKNKILTAVGAGMVVVGTVVLTITGIGEAPVIAIVSAVVVLVGVIAALFKVTLK